MHIGNKPFLCAFIIKRLEEVMFNLWCMLEFSKGSSNLSIKQIVKFLRNYVLPTIITVIIANNINKNINFHVKDTIINLIIINSFYIGVVHLYIQKNFFMKLDGDIIIKFMPNKAIDYILLRIFMIFMKAYLPVIIPSVSVLGIFFVNSKLILYLCSLLLIVSAIAINTLIAIYWRYFINTTKIIYVKIGNFIFSICIFILFVLISFFTPIWILSNVETSLIHGNIRSIVELNLFVLLMFILVGMLTFVIFKCSKDYFSVRARMLIFNRKLTISIYKSKISTKIERFYQRVYSICLSTLEKDIFNKDVKEIIRESKYSFVFVSILQILFITTILFFNFADQTNTTESSIFISKLLTVMVIGQLLVSFYVSKATFEKHINIENDFEVLEKYDIKFTKNNVIKAKTRILGAIVFPKIYFIFSILILSSIIQSNNYLALILLLSMIQIIFIKKSMELCRVKSINKLNSRSEVIKQFNVAGIFITMMSFVLVYKDTDRLQYLQGQIVLILITIIMYIFNSTFNNAKIKRGEGKE